LVKGQERNIAQLERIGAAVKWKWNSKESEVKEDGDDEEVSEDGPRESQEKRTLLSTFC